MGTIVTVAIRQIGEVGVVCQARWLHGVTIEDGFLPLQSAQARDILNVKVQALVPNGVDYNVHKNTDHQGESNYTQSAITNHRGFFGLVRKQVVYIDVSYHRWYARHRVKMQNAASRQELLLRGVVNALVRGLNSAVWAWERMWPGFLMVRCAVILCAAWLCCAMSCVNVLRVHLYTLWYVFLSKVVCRCKCK